MYGIYRPGEGYWTRAMTAIAAGVLVLIGAGWLWTLLEQVRIGSIDSNYIGGAGAVLLVAIFGGLIYWLVGVKPASVDFLVATEVEMKAVNWSTRREIFGSTWVVLAVSLLITLFVYAFDLAFSYGFARMGVLDAGI